MYIEINEQLLTLKEKINEKNRYERLLLQTRQKLQSESQKLKELTKILSKEKYDVKRLEGVSITSLFYNVLGTKEQKLDKERQEFIAAKLKHDSSQSSIKVLERDISHFESRFTALGNPEEEYDALLKEKEQLLMKVKSKELLNIINQLSNLSAIRKELDEAISAGDEVRHELANVLNNLKSAKNWGTFDLVGGGILATAVKHSKMDDAKQSVQKVQYLMHKFQRELSDLSGRSKFDLGVELSSFETFGDYFFDGLIFDWVVQSKINRSHQNVNNVEKDISDLVFKLCKKRNDIKKQISSLEDKRKTFIEEIK